MSRLKTTHKILLAAALIFSATLLTSSHSYAWSPCDELNSPQQNNSSIQNACYQLVHDNSITEHGAAWLTNYISSPDSDYYNTTITTDKTSGTIDISILYVVVRKYNGDDGCRTYGSTTYCKRYAREVKVLPSDPGRMNPNQGNGLTTVSYLKNVPTVIDGGKFPTSNFISSYFNHKNLKLDIDKFRKAVPANSCGNGNPNCYQTTAYVFRCYSLLESGTFSNTYGGAMSIYGGAPENSCSAVPSTIRAIIPPATPTPDPDPDPTPTPTPTPDPDPTPTPTPTPTPDPDPTPTPTPTPTPDPTPTPVPRPVEDPGNTDTLFPSDTPVTCRSSADAGPYYGNTTSSSSATNATSKKSVAIPSTGMNASGGSGYIFAKPGDYISFTHSLCFGTQGLKGGSDKANYLKIDSTKSLGGSASIVGKGKITLDRNTKTPSQLSGKVNELKDYGFVVDSPRGTAYKVTDASLGTSISQTFTHNILDGYVNTRSKKVGSCSCGTNTAKAEYENLSSYSSAKKTSSYNIWGKLNNFGCTAGGNCGCKCASGTAPDKCTSWSCGTQYKYRTDQSVSFPKTYDNATTDITKTAQVYIPYNFTTSVDSDRQGVSSGGVVYAGEAASSKLRYEVNAKVNQPVTGSSTTTYLTKLPSNSKYRAIAFTTTSSSNLGGNNNASISGDNLCGYFGKTLGSNCKIIGQGNGAISTKDISVNDIVPDVAEGTKYCIAIGVYPADSHNWATPNNDNNRGIAITGGNTWNISGASCRTVAKKPNFQVWNGGVYSGANISTSVSVKVPGANLSTSTTSAKTIFGSWTEQLAIAKGTIKGFASGATLGYSGYNQAKPGGHSYTTNFFSLSPLTVSNSTSLSSPGRSQINSNTTLASHLLTHYSPDRVEDVVRIDSNIILPTSNFSQLSDLSQNIIFAKKGIEISSDVTRIDAWLVVEDGYVNTCAQFSKNSTPSTGPCNKQLIINGPVITKKLYLNRTAGAGNNNDSITPAEVFNLRPDAYLWAYQQARQSSEAYITYSRELAPRY